MLFCSHFVDFLLSLVFTARCVQFTHTYLHNLNIYVYTNQTRCYFLEGFFVYDFLPKHRSICIFVIFQVRTRLICRIIDDKSAHPMQNSHKTKNPNKKSPTILTHFINFIHTKHLEKRGVVFHTFISSSCMSFALHSFILTLLLVFTTILMF